MLIRYERIGKVEAELDQHEGVLFEGDWLPLAGQSVADAKAMLRDTWTIPYFSDAIVNGHTALVNQFLRPGEHLQFLQRYGIKSGDDRPAEDAEADALLHSHPELAQIAAEVDAMNLPAKRRLAILTLRVFRFAERRFGPVIGQSAAVLDEVITKLTDEKERLAVARPERDHPGGTVSVSAKARRELHLQVDEQRHHVLLDGVRHHADPALVAILACLLAANGERRTRADMKREKMLLENEKRIDRLIFTLKDEFPEFRSMIESDRRGYRLKTS